MAEDEPPPVDVVMVHDERMAADLGGEVPLVLSGHTHDAAEGRIQPLDDEDPEDGAASTDEAGTVEDAADEDTTTSTDAGDEGADDGVEDGPGAGDDETVLLVEGSTGGAGLRGLQGDEPEPLSASILYFDPDTMRMVAYDRITVAWLGDAGATIERHIVGAEPPGGG
jgi:hypothetical protein